MKDPRILLIAVLAVCAMGAGGYSWNQSQVAATSAQQVAELKAENTKLSGDLANAQEKVSALESESEQLRAARAISSARLEPAAPVAAATPAEDEAKPKNRGSFFANMLKDPAMRKMLAAQQAGALRGYYSDFVKQAHLTPDEADKFFQMLSDRQSSLMDSSANMLSGSGVDMSAATAAVNASNDALKDMLGPDRFAQYQAFEKTLGDRIMVQQFNQQLGSVGSPLQDYQSQALTQIMSQERAGLPNFQSANGAGLNQLQNMTPDQMDQYSQQVDAVNQRVYNRAMSVLTPPQLSAFAAWQKNMATAQVAGLKMTQQMFKGDQ